MRTRRKVALLIGSLRKGSYTRMVANALVEAAPDSLEWDYIEIGKLPLYNQDEEGTNPPAAWMAFRQKVKSADALLFATPEYNRSVPAALKNAIDIGSRPYGQNVWDGKPGAVVSVSPGVLGGFGANHHLRQSLLAVNIPVLQQPEAYIGSAAGLFEDGKLNNDETRAFFRKFMEEFARWIETQLAPLNAHSGRV